MQTHYHIFHEDFSKRAGTERVLVNIINCLLSSGRNKITLLLASNEKPLVFGLDALPIEVFYLCNGDKEDNRFKLLGYYKSLFYSTKKYFNSLSTDKVNVVIGANHLLSACAFFAIKNKDNFRIIACEHFSFHIFGLFSKILRSFFYSKICVVTLTDRDRDIIREKYNPKFCIAIPNAIPFSAKPYKGIDSKKILAVGRYSYQKGFDSLIKAYAPLEKEFPEWELYIIGDDYGERTNMDSIITNYGLSNVYLEPSTANIELEYDNSSFFVMSSRFEGFPMVLLEAIGSGLPLISFDCPTGPRELIDSSNGILVKDQSIEELTAAMRTLMLNRGLRLDFARGAEKKSLMYSMEVINKKWENLFLKVESESYNG
ncbi:MAG: glycosyltransferase [Sphingobacterium sp.]